MFRCHIKGNGVIISISTCSIKVIFAFKVADRSFSLSRNKKINWKPSSGRSQENEMFKRLIIKQFVQVSGLCGPKFLRYLPKRFTHLVELCMETPYWCTVLVHQYGRRKSTKTSEVHFFYKSSFFSLEN